MGFKPADLIEPDDEPDYPEVEAAPNEPQAPHPIDLDQDVMP